MSKAKRIDADKIRYDFSRHILCPRCGYSTRARSTQGQVQWRQCNCAVCRHSFKAIGQPVQEQVVTTL